MGPFLGSIIFEAAGAFFRWLCLLILHKIKGKKVIGFGQVWAGKKGADLQENFEYGISNIALGTAIVMGIIGLLIYLGV